MSIKRIVLRLLRNLFLMVALVTGATIGLYYYLQFDDIDLLKHSYISVRSGENDEIQYIVSNQKPDSWVTLDKINLKAAHAIVVSEDWDYYNHPGIDVRQIQTAILNSLFLARPIRGASTITQQLAKNLFLSSERSIDRKIKESLMAFYMEKMLGKKRILEIYLNIIEYGKDIYGIKAASRHYFNKTPAQLNIKEGAFLAMILPSPVKYSISFRKKKLTPFAEKIISEIVHKMTVIKYIEPEEKETALNSKFYWEESINPSPVLQ